MPKKSKKTTTQKKQKSRKRITKNGGGGFLKKIQSTQSQRLAIARFKAGLSGSPFGGGDSDYQPQRLKDSILYRSSVYNHMATQKFLHPTQGGLLSNIKKGEEEGEGGGEEDEDEINDQIAAAHELKKTAEKIQKKKDKRKKKISRKGPPTIQDVREQLKTKVLFHHSTIL